jgi:hypothetical protein
MLPIPEDNSNGMLTVSIKTLVENWFQPAIIDLGRL